MLRITEAERSGAAVTLRVEGRMVGEWGAFLEKHCNTLLGAANALRLDLDGLAYADANGIQALRRLRAHGVRFGGCPPLILEMIDQGTSGGPG